MISVLDWEEEMKEAKYPSFNYLLTIKQKTSGK